MHRRFVLPVLLSAFVSPALFAACVGDEPQGAQDAGAADAPTVTPDATSTAPKEDGAAPSDAAVQAAVTVDPPRVTVKAGASAEVEAKLDRRGLAGELAITVTGLPKGVTAAPVAFAAGAASAKVVLTAAADATLGDAAIRVEAPGATAAPVALLVAGPSGTLDTTFDSDGLVLDTQSPAGAFFAVKVQADNKILAVGAVSGAGGGGWTVKRFNADGSPDAAFNTAAAAVVPTTGMARAIAVDPANGKILVAGSSAGTERLTVVRLNGTGTADQGFANAGTLLVDTVTHSQGSRALGVLALPGSLVLVAGTKNEGAGTVGIVERYTAAGVKDPAFVSYTMPVAGTLSGIVPLASGAFFASGTDASLSPPSQTGVRLLANGTPDAAFGTSGRRTYASGCRGAASALATNGDVVVTGQDITGPSYCVTRIAASGNGEGVYTRTRAGGNSEQFTAAATGPNNTTYAAGHGGGSQDRVALVERRLPGGALDPAFATGGSLEIEDPATPDTYGYQIQAATTADDGRLVIVGNRTLSTRGYFVGRIWQ